VSRFPAIASGAYPGIPTITGDVGNHQISLNALKEALEIHERRTADSENSFIRVQDLVDLRFIEKKGDHYYISTQFVESLGIRQRSAMSMYIEKLQTNTEQAMHGGIDLLDSAASVSSGVPFDVADKMPGKLLFVVNAGSDLDGTLTVTGTSVDRDTGVETGSDTDNIPITAVSTDGSDTDAEGNNRYSFTDAYITSKWYTGTAIQLTTTDLNLSDFDIYHVSFEQFNDSPQPVTLETFDMNVQVTNATAWIYAYLYTLTVTGSKASLTRIASLELDQADSIANTFARLRRGNLDTEIHCQTDGIFTNLFAGPTATFIQNVSMKIWASHDVHTS